MEKPRIFLDLETYSFSTGNMAPKPVVASLADFSSAGLLHMSDPASWLRVEDYLDRAIAGELVVAGHGIAYDMACLFAHASDPLKWGRKIFAAYEAGGVEDTGVRQKLLDIRDGCFRGFYDQADGSPMKISYHLADLVPRHFSRELPKPQDVRTSYGELYGTPISWWPKAYVDYAQQDSVETKLVWLRQQEIADRTPGVLEDQHRQARAAFFLKLCSNWGPVCDAAAVDALERSAKSDCLAMLLELRRAGLVRPNGTRNMAAAQHAMSLACHAAGITPPLTPTHTVSVDSDACASVPDSEVMQAWSEYISIQNVLAKDIPMLRLGCGRPIHTFFEELVQSGRISSSNPNLTNVKRSGGFRECFVPRPGHRYAVADFSKAELHSLAEVCFQIFGYSTMGDALNAGVDVHATFAKRLLGRDDLGPDDRQKAKAANFGFPGGLGAKHFREYAKKDYGVVFTEEGAERARQDWFAQWPEMREFLDWVGRSVGDAEATITQLFSGRMRGLCGYTDGANTLFQGLTADYAKASGWNISKEMYTVPDSPLYGSRMVNFIHDEFLSEVPDDPDIADAAARRQAQIMEETSEAWTPHVPVKAEPVLSVCWSKKAKQIFDTQGRLVPWSQA